ncbi:cytochrome P450 [Streptosporangium becharense]|uniref:Cytochrome P450 n=1 Tax=Streptosporangium becharense TaxID=1816182 RepID=A0A7W9IGC9_9ACTN|nr:cytochrome P450 [Streptosporangium becharense]MBB2914944.1 cytochrome P450 [Streptosporangium becharense]MBB5820245.1 cytochrome P450 [Streptosporangium becharense]
MTINDQPGGADLVGLLGAEACPEGLPVINVEMLRDPETLRRMREAGDLHRVNLGGREAGWLLTSHDTSWKALVDPRMRGESPYSRKRAPGELADEEDLFFLPNEEHARLRRMISRPLTPRRVAALTDRIQKEADALLDAMPPSEAVDFIASFARPFPVAVLCELLGIPQDGRRYIRDYIYGWVAEAGEATPVTESAGLALADYLRTLIAQRRAEPKNDLISAMAQTEGPETSEEDVLSAVRLLLVAGNRPVTRLLTKSLGVLLHDRSHWQRLVDDPTRIDATVEELLRIVTPIALSSRNLKEEVEIGGVLLPEGAGVHCALGAVNRDPAHFTDPDTFDPERPDNPHMAFGLGHRHCLGAALARAEARIVFGTLTRRFPDMRILKDQEVHGLRPGTSRLPVVLCPVP